MLEHADATTNHGLSWSVMQPARDTWDFGPPTPPTPGPRPTGSTRRGRRFAWDQQVLDDLAPWVLDITDPDELRAVLGERADGSSIATRGSTGST